MFNDLPVFGVCGWSGSGKTTLLEGVLPLLLERGLRVVVVKHDVHGITQESPDKDSQRLFSAGADVLLHSPGESVLWRKIRDELSLETELSQLAEQYDLILVEGYKRAPWPKVWLTKSDESAPPQGIGNLLCILPWDTNRTAALVAILDEYLKEMLNRAPIFGCILIGGKSTRMGLPKHLLPCADGSGQTWLHRTVSLLEQICRKVVLVGAGAVPDDLHHLLRMVDAMEIDGPMAGLLAAMRWAPHATWLLAACDLPSLSHDALKWLVAQRRPGVWAVIPYLDEPRHVEPLLACYDFHCRSILEQSALAGNCSLQDMARHPKILRAAVPPELTSAWKDADTLESAADHTGDTAANSKIKVLPI